MRDLQGFWGQVAKSGSKLSRFGMRKGVETVRALGHSAHEEGVEAFQTLSASASKAFRMTLLMVFAKFVFASQASAQDTSQVSFGAALTPPQVVVPARGGNPAITMTAGVIMTDRLHGFLDQGKGRALTNTVFKSLAGSSEPKPIRSREVAQ